MFIRHFEVRAKFGIWLPDYNMKIHVGLKQ